jgi:hypothetical protein
MQEEDYYSGLRNCVVSWADIQVYEKYAAFISKVEVRRLRNRLGHIGKLTRVVMRPKERGESKGIRNGATTQKTTFLTINGVKTSLGLQH